MAMNFATPMGIPPDFLSTDARSLETENNLWRVTVEDVGEKIKIEASDGWGSYMPIYGTYIRPKDTLLDNLLGRNYEARIRRAIDKWQKFCDKKNEIEFKAKMVAEKSKEAVR